MKARTPAHVNVEIEEIELTRAWARFRLRSEVLANPVNFAPSPHYYQATKTANFISLFTKARRERQHK
jgi:hypothetical protein